jgi:UDP-N-acetylglucosamine--N-acetylmuramyl-(pentapeptide) pyrophosphoryl-undecaprenol N-acetylglucosamine transferase
MSKTILFTGGHHNSALVVAKQLKAQGHNILWAGHKFTMRGDINVSAEYQEVTQAGFPFYELKTGKFYRVSNPLEYIKIAMGFLQAFIYLLQSKPDLIFSFGGYLSVPIVIAGWVLRIPSVTHEQTVTAGWANHAVTPFVKKIFLTHQSSLKNYPKEKSVVVGLPLRPSLLEKTSLRKPKRPLIYITCGKQGSHTINKSIFPLIPELVEKYQVIHQTGAHTHVNDQDKARRVKASLPKTLRPRYKHKPYYFESEATRFLKTASLIISRSGAHITYELLLLGKRSVVIPIPWVSHNEQHKNAELLKRLGRTVILKEKDLTPETLKEAIQEALKLPKKKKPTSIKNNATELIIKQLQPFLNETS